MLRGVAAYHSNFHAVSLLLQQQQQQQQQQHQQQLSDSAPIKVLCCGLWDPLPEGMAFTNVRQGVCGFIIAEPWHFSRDRDACIETFKLPQPLLDNHHQTVECSRIPCQLGIPVCGLVVCLH